eukprot:762760-Hanusia_phi.AAC.11
MLGDRWNELAASIQETPDTSCAGDLEKMLGKAASDDELDGVSMGRMSLHIPPAPFEIHLDEKTKEL